MKPLTKTWARKQLKAVNILIEYYKREEKPNFCPFGHPTKFISHRYGTGCENCSWVVFTGYDCEGEKWVDGKPTSMYIRLAYNHIPILKRLPRLYGWRKRLLNIINKPTKRGK